MKRFLRIAQVLAILVVGSVLSISCILDSGGSSGSVQFTIKGAGDTARIYLATTQGVLAPIGGDKDYLEVSLSSGETTVTIEGLPAGAEYNAFFGLGNRDNGWLETEWYAVSAPFEISAGTNVEVDLGVLNKTEPPNFDLAYSPQLMNSSLKGVVVSGGNIYTPTSNTLYRGANVSSMIDSFPLTAGHTANSISPGIVTAGGAGGVVFVNTNIGILPFTAGSAFDTDFSSNLGTVSILDSGGHDPGNEYIFFQRDGGLGGVESSGVGETVPDGWVNIDLSDVIQGQPIKDIAVRNTGGTNQAYFATVLGSFFLDEAMLNQQKSDFLNYADFFSVGTENIPVISLDFNSNSNFYYLGTEDGVWRSTDPAFAAITEIPGTSGRRYTDIVAASANPRWAARSPLYLVIGDTLGTGVQMTIPFNVLPDGMTGMAWDGATLVIAADEGLISITPP